METTGASKLVREQEVENCINLWDCGRRGRHFSGESSSTNNSSDARARALPTSGARSECIIVAAVVSRHIERERGESQGRKT